MTLTGQIIRYLTGLMVAWVLVLSIPADAKGTRYSSGNVSSSVHSVRPYVTKRGTYVPGHMQTNPNHTKRDNFSTKGNVNPYTGKAGTKNP
jgi:hypothetical protein